WYEDRVQDRLRGLQRHDGRSDAQTQPMPSQEGELLLDAIAAERRHLVQLRDQNVISDQVLRRVGHELDLEEMRIRSDMLLPDDRLVVGAVEEVKDNEIRVNTGELMPRFLPLKEGKQDQGRPLIKGDLVEIWVNNQDLVVDYHPLDTLGWHRIIRGMLVQPLAVDQEWAVIKPAKGKEEAFAIRPLAKSKVAALPVGAPALFLIDKAKKIVDATFGNEQALQQAIRGWQGSPPMGVDREIRGTFVESSPSNQVTIVTSEGTQQTFEARSFLQKKLKDLARGTSVILLIDGENKVTDLAIPPGGRRLCGNAVRNPRTAGQ